MRRVLAAGWMLLSAGAFGADALRMEGKRLVVEGPALELRIEGGAVVFAKDRKTGEVLAQGDPWPVIPATPTGFSSGEDWYGFKVRWAAEPRRYAEDKKVQEIRRRPTADSPVEFRRDGADAGTLVYRGLGGGSEELSISVRLDRQTGEILLSAAARAPAPAAPPVSVSVPILNCAGRGTILGNGARYARSDGRAADYTCRVANGLYSPNAVVVEGAKGCLAAWDDNTGFPAENICLAHAPETDHVFLVSGVPYGGRPPTEDATLLTGGTWRIAAVPHWLEAARRYRRTYEKKTGARPLWENGAAWVRSVHAASVGAPTPANAEGHYGALAKIADPKKILLFYWNGDRIVFFGDHRYAPGVAVPQAPVIPVITKFGFPWMGYHPYVLIQPEKELAKRLAEMAARKWALPEGYVFTPDYGGPPEKFWEYVKPACGGYYGKMEDARLWQMHPGSRLTQTYLARNFGNYCAFHSMNGAYMDIMGGDGQHQFAPEKKVQDGADWRKGEFLLGKHLREKLPDLAMMSEYQSEWVIPWAFYSWEGSGHVRRTAEVGTVFNHPFRTALWGSYTWTREDGVDPADAALVGGLPEIALGDDWSEARARLFTGEELFNDLPDRWDDDVVACYRGRGGKRFEFRRLPFGDGFVEVTRRGREVRLGRYIGRTTGLPEKPTRIQRWVAYSGDRPIGLNPARTYPFIAEAPQAGDDLRVTALPEGAFVSAVRHLKGWSVVEFDSAGAPASGTATVSFGRRCLGIRSGAEDLAGPFEPGRPVVVKTSVPGGFAVLWDEPQPTDGRFRGELVAAGARTLANGLPHGGWCYNGEIRAAAATLGGVEYPSVQVGKGRYRGSADCWVRLAAGAKPVLAFDVGYPPPEKGRTRPPVVCAVFVNGERVWMETVKAADAWLPRSVPLGRFAGRTVLLTLSARSDGERDGDPGTGDVPVYFGRARVDANPASLARPTAGSLPGPREVLFADAFAGSALGAGWTSRLSPETGAGGSISVVGGELVLLHQHYKHAYAVRSLPATPGNLAAQVRVRVGRTGGDAGWNPGLGLYWEGGGHCFMTAGGYRGGDEVFVVRGWGARRIPVGGRTVYPADDNRYDFWVKIALTPQTIRYLSSLDGAAWTVEAEIPRPKEAAGPPKLLILGSGAVGKGEVFSNDAQWPSNIRRSSLSELVVGVD